MRELLTIAAPQILSPSNWGTTFDQTPQLEWAHDGSAAEYEVWVTELGANPHAVYIQDGFTNNFMSVPSNLAVEDHRFWVRAFDENGVASSWSSAVNFEVTNDRPILHAATITPGGTGAVLNWDQLGGAETYEVWLSDRSIGAILIESGVSTTSYVVSDLPRGRDYRYWVRGISADGDASLWSFNSDFTLPQPPLGQPEILAPARYSSTADSRPVIRWTEDPAATSYEISILQLTGGGSSTEVVSVSGIQGTEYQPEVDLNNYRHRVWVRSIDANGNAAAWGVGSEFTAITEPDVWSVSWDYSASRQQVNIHSPYNADGFQVNLELRDSSGTLVYSKYGLPPGLLTLPELIGNEIYSVYLQGVGTDGSTSGWANAASFTGQTSRTLVNSDFSQNSVATAWDVFYYFDGDTIPYSNEHRFIGWHSDKPIELHSNGFIELDSDLAGHPSRFGGQNQHPNRIQTPNGGANSTVWQDVLLAPNTQYDLSFIHAGTPNSLSDDNSLALWVIGAVQGGSQYTGSSVAPGASVTRQTTFRTTGSGTDPVSVRVEFRDTGHADNDLGNLVGSVSLTKSPQQSIDGTVNVSMSSPEVEATNGITGHRVIVDDLRQPVQLSISGFADWEVAGGLELEYSGGTLSIYDAQIDPANPNTSGTLLASGSDLVTDGGFTLQELRDGVTVYAEGLAVGTTEVRLKVLAGDGTVAIENSATAVVTGSDPLIIYVEFRDNSIPVPVKIPAGHPLVLTNAEWETILVVNRQATEQVLGTPTGLPASTVNWVAGLTQKIARAETLLNTTRTRITIVQQMLANPHGVSHQSFFNAVNASVYAFDLYFDAFTEGYLSFSDYFTNVGQPPAELEDRVFRLPVHVDGLDMKFSDHQLDAAASALSDVTQGVNAQLRYLDNVETGIYVAVAVGVGIAFAPAAIWLAGTAPAVAVGTVVAEAAPWLLLHGALQSAGARLEDGQTGGKVILGTVSDLIGTTSLRLGIQQEDIITGQRVELTPGQRATHIVGGGVQLVLALTGLTSAGRTVSEELRVFTRGGGGSGGGLQLAGVSAPGMSGSSTATATFGATVSGTSSGALVGTLGGLRPVIVYMTRDANEAAYPFEEEFDSLDDALGDVSPEGVRILEVRETTNPRISRFGFTIAYRVESSSGEIWTVFGNPSTRKFAGAHLSSTQY